MRFAANSIDPLLEERLAQMRARVARAPGGREAAGRLFLATLFLAVAVPLALFAGTHRHPAWWLYPAFVAGYAIASAVRFEVGGIEALPSEIVLVAMLFVLPARSVPLVVCAGMLLVALPAVLRHRFSPLRALVSEPANSLFALGPALVFLAANEPRADRHGAVVLAVAVALQFAFDFAGGSLLAWLTDRTTPLRLLRPFAWTFAIDVLLVPLGLLTAAAARVDHAALLLPLPLIGLLALFAHERRGRIDSILELSAAYRGTAFLLWDVVEADDASTGEHSQKVVDLVLAVADRIGLDPQTRRTAEFTALLHDVGKLKVPREIIDKSGALTAEERAIVNTHTIEGERLLRRVGGLLGEVGAVVRSCHERWDGSGYPDGLVGEQIPLVARIVSCCDAYDAMTSDRAYRRALGHAAAVEELVAHRGTQFDPAIVDVLLEVVGGRAQAEAEEAQDLLACPRCGHHSMLDAPVQENYRVCLRCGLVPVRISR